MILAKYVDESRKGRPRQDSSEILSSELCPVSKDSDVRPLDPGTSSIFAFFVHDTQTLRTDPPPKQACTFRLHRCRIIRRLQVPVLCSRHLCRSQHSCGSLQLSCKTCPDRRNFGRTACCPLSAPYKLPPRRAKDLRLVQPRVSARLRIETRQHETQHAQKGKGANGQSPSVAVQQRTTEIEMRARERRRPGSGWAEARVCLLRPPACVFDEGDGGSQGRHACARGQERGHAHGPCSEGQTSFPRACGSFLPPPAPPVGITRRDRIRAALPQSQTKTEERASTTRR